MSILRSGEIFSNREGGGGELFREEERAVGWERWDGLCAGWVVRASPPRPLAGLDFLREEGFERVIGMTKSLYCLLVIKMKSERACFAVQVLLTGY
jgi:hypothetical protein